MINYVKTPPEVVIEIDTRADLRKYSGEMLSYMKGKISDLSNAGVKKLYGIQQMIKKLW
ncbi:MAG: hypothetical protein Q9M89_05575 [Persephonella sp.]|nr:hypothetical protein [Persephonella sp.]